MTEKKKIRLAVLMGGTSTERDVSLNSGMNVCNSLPPDRYLIKPVVITGEGCWMLYDGWLKGDEKFVGMPIGTAEVDAGHALSELLDHRIELVFIALHGPGGEDGMMQGFLETAGIAHTGSGVLGNALCMDKILSKQLMLHSGIPTPEYLAASQHDLTGGSETTVAGIEEHLGYPCVVKVNNQGSSRNVGIAHNRKELKHLFEKIAPSGNYFLIEKFITGREVTCAVIDKPGRDKPVALPPTELVPLTRNFFDYHAKYTPGATDEITPARISDTQTAQVRDLALRCHSALRCGGMSRTDMILDGDEVYVLEINTIPGLTTTSLIPQAAAAAGIGFVELLEIQIRWALEQKGQ